jgi:hypothetical protein
MALLSKNLLAYAEKDPLATATAPPRPDAELSWNVDWALVSDPPSTSMAPPCGSPTLAEVASFDHNVDAVTVTSRSP